MMLSSSVHHGLLWNRDWNVRRNSSSRRVVCQHPPRCASISVGSRYQKIQITSEELKNFLKDDSKLQNRKNLNSLAMKLGTDLKNGLTTDDEDFSFRRLHFGSNYLNPLPPVSFLEILKEALDDFTILILIISGVLSLVLESSLSPGGEYGWLEGTAILASVAVVVTVSAITNFQKEIKFRELSTLNEDSQVRVWRDGMESSMSCFQLLVGDLVKIETGDILQSDGVLVDGSIMRVDESHLTGESDEVCKSHNCSDPFVYSGSKVNEGVGRMLVLAVGSNSKQGSIASLASGQNPNFQEDKELFRQKTVLTEKLEKLAGDIGRFGLLAAILTLASMSSQFTYFTFFQDHQSWNWQYLETYLHQLITSITILVVAVPEGLPLASTLALAFSVQRMMQDNNLVRHLDACETMGSITTICTDKTGTLTCNDLNVKEVGIGGQDYYLTFLSEPLLLDESTRKLLSEAIALNTTASLGGKGKKEECIGNRTECGLLKFVNDSLHGDYLDIRRQWRYLEVFPFTSELKRMSVLVQNQTKTIVHLKGAPEIILPYCTSKLGPAGEKIPLSERDRVEMLNGKSQLRRLAFACKVVEDRRENLEEELCLIGIIGLSDSIRAEAPKAIQQCHRAGVEVKMLTGDNIITATSIAQSCNILQEDFTPSMVMDGPEFRQRVMQGDGELDFHEFVKIWGDLKVMARCTPEDKYLLVRGIQSIRTQGHREVIAMTGDGTNDAPALKIADVGFAMASGTPIARDASDILLLDDSFESIVNAMKWGRNVFSSVMKFLQFQLTVNVVAVVTACTGAIFLRESPLSAVQMLWVNMIMDSLASLSLATEPPSEDVLDLPPNLSDAPILSPSIIKNIIGGLQWLRGGSRLLQFFKGEVLFDGDQVHNFTLVFNAFVCMQLANQLNARKIHDGHSILEGLPSNRLFLTIWSMECILQYLIVEFGGVAFQTVPLSGVEWWVCIGFGALSLPIRSILTQQSKV